ncbi:MAG: 50S ribosomal protein L17 [Thermoanaerobaculia bacterium]|jgi:large subunit ribosomal protein L17|nr:50S ribosomal protein L17 [Thermoanaerobaculia bacterium]MBP9824758.1 50S ribosomal protein L17 [Thermoanaerobaculia bacterium]
MRHNMAHRKLGRTASHRVAMFRNQLASLVMTERIVTTLPKAKELRPIAEKVITKAKHGSVHDRRIVGRWLLDRDHIQKLFDVIAPRFATREGGYLRIVKLGARQGDGAEMAVLEFVDFEMKKKSAAPAPSDAKGKKAKGGDAEAAGEAGEEKAAKPKKEKAEKVPGTKRSAGDKKAAGRGAAAPKAKTTKAPNAPKKTSAPKKVGGG